jgi:phospholipase/carboxylesterase
VTQRSEGARQGAHTCRHVAAADDDLYSPLVLLHGSEGTEADLLPLADELAPGSAKIGIRGAVSTGAGHAFFRRFPDRRVDEADLAARLPILAEFIQDARMEHNLARRPFVIGFSNGAIMAAALLMTHPELFAGAVLFRPLSPFTDDVHVRLDKTPVLVVDGAGDGRRSPGDGRRLAGRLRDAGAVVTHHVLRVGHSLTDEDSRLAREWLRTVMLV